MVEEFLVHLIEKDKGQYFGKYKAEVVDNDDPERRGRLKLNIPGVLGNDVVSGWAEPCMPYGGAPNQGFFFIPESGSWVWAEFEAGFLDRPIWVGAVWSKPGGSSEVPKPNGLDGKEEADVQRPPTRKIIKTRKGHTIQLEDADGKEMIMLLEATNGNLVVMNKDGIKLKDKKGNMIEMKTDAFTITSKVAFTIDASGQAITIIGKTIDLNKG